MTQDLINKWLTQVGKNFIPFTDATQAIKHIVQLYENNSALLKRSFRLGQTKEGKGAVYPYLALPLISPKLNDNFRPSFDVVLKEGFYGTTITRPDIFYDYLQEQINALTSYYDVPVYVGESHLPIPLPYMMEKLINNQTDAEISSFNEGFTLPNLSITDDNIADYASVPSIEDPSPLALFTAQRTDYSLARLSHYTGTSPNYFQNFILLTNYQRYIHTFREYGLAQLRSDEKNYDYFVEPGDIIRRSEDNAESSSVPLQQMPAYHLCRKDNNGITMINIGVGPANAKTITDHLSVLRPHCWLMLGHCAGLRETQKLGDYVLAHGYMRDDHVLNDVMPLAIPVPAIAEIQVALQQVAQRITKLSDREIKTRMRTGTVMTTDNRNWELRFKDLIPRINLSRAIAVDMESATIATNGLRFRVPYGTLLCISDKPLHGELKLPGMADNFYRERVQQHLLIGIKTMEKLRKTDIRDLHSRKLRGLYEPPFR